MEANLELAGRRAWRRRTLIVAPILAAGGTRHAAANAWPTRPIRLVIPFPPGNTADIIARIMSEPLAAALQQPVVIDNRPGAGGALAAENVARATDGHSFFLTTASPVVILPAFVSGLRYDPMRDFAPIALLGSGAVMLVANRDVPATTLPELVAWLRSRPGAVNFASTGRGTLGHLTMERFMRATGTQMVHVAYRGSTAAAADLISGQVSLLWDTLASTNALAREGRVRALAVSSRARSAFAPDVPSLAESGVPELFDHDVVGWIGLFGPAATPQPVVQRLASLAGDVVAMREYAARLAAASLTAPPPTPTESFARTVRDDFAAWSDLARATGMTLDG